MIHIDGAIVVEGKYDKIKLSRVVDCPIITTGGFGVFKSEETKALLRWYAQNGGITVLTDSDSAGFKIRGYIKGIVPKGTVRNAYIPDVFGKESRKEKPSAEGKLGVEGIDTALLRKCLEKAGVCGKISENKRRIERRDLYEDGLFGREDSSKKRAALLKLLGLPERLSTSGLIDVLNCAYTYEAYKEAVSKL